MQRKTGADLSRKDFLKLGGAGLAGAALLGAAGCGLSPNLPSSSKNASISPAGLG
jgi:hypothetical protein